MWFDNSLFSYHRPNLQETTNIANIVCPDIRRSWKLYLKQINITIPVDEFDKRLAEIKDIQLVDVRTPEEYQGGHLKNAINYNLNGDDFDSNLNKLDKNKLVMVYCLAGGRSAKAAKKMKEKGFVEVYNMKGGIMKWNAANKPLDKNPENQISKGMSVSDFNKKLHPINMC